MDTTQRLSLPLIQPGQAQKEITHNEALQILDALVVGAVDAVAANDPPSQPSEGACYIIGDAPSGEWSQNSGDVASYTSGGWRFMAPVPGMRLLVKSSDTVAVYGSSGWETGTIRGSKVVINGDQVLSDRAGAIDDPSGGSTIDLEVRSAVTQMLSVLRHHGLIWS